MSGSLRGILAPVVTTFQPDSGDLDLRAFAENIVAHMDADLHGVVVAGSTGEAALLDETERRQLIETARRVVPEDRLLIAGVGVESTRATIRLARQAAAAGANAVLVVSPHYYTAAMTAEVLRAHFRRVADESPVPIVLYNIPKYVGFTIAPSLVIELAKHENIIGIKDSSGDRDLLSVYLTEQSDRFSVLTGSGALLHFALKTGARGGVLAVSLFAPELCIALYDAMERGHDAPALAAQARLGPMSNRIVADFGVAGVKAALDALGLNGGPMRAPLMSLSDDDTGRVRQALLEGALATAS
jgi:4-hydroxy-2-oxoglutarate aldolase